MLWQTHTSSCVRASAAADSQLVQVNKWVAIACPFLGAPGFVADTLLTGIQFAWGWQRYFFVSKVGSWRLSCRLCYSLSLLGAGSGVSVLCLCAAGGCDLVHV